MGLLRLSLPNSRSQYLAIATVVAAAVAGFCYFGAPGGLGLSVRPSMADVAPPQGGGDAFLTTQAPTQWRVPMLLGMNVYDANGKLAGTVNDVLIDRGGVVQDIVIGVGGFLGIGVKHVALPFTAVRWKTDRHDATPYALTLLSQADCSTASASMAPAKTEIKSGSPHKAYVAMTLAQLKAAPAFKYAPSTAGALRYNSIASFPGAPYE